MVYNKERSSSTKREPKIPILGELVLIAMLKSYQAHADFSPWESISPERDQVPPIHPSIFAPPGH